MLTNIHKKEINKRRKGNISPSIEEIENHIEIYLQ
jgi:hypothetical protein